MSETHHVRKIIDSTIILANKSTSYFLDSLKKIKLLKRLWIAKPYQGLLPKPFLVPGPCQWWVFTLLVVSVERKVVDIRKMLWNGQDHLSEFLRFT